MKVRFFTLLSLMVVITLLVLGRSESGAAQPQSAFLGAPSLTATALPSSAFNTVATAATIAGAQNVELVSHIGGKAREVTVVGNYAYVVRDMELAVIDVSDPANPTEVGSYEASSATYGIAVAGQYAYIVGCALTVLDVSDPASPSGMGSYHNPTRACVYYDVAVAGDYAYVAADGLRVFDASDPANPTEAGSISTGGSLAEGVAVAGGYAYVADRDGLHVIDVSIPSDPTEVGLCDALSYGGGMAVAGDYAYVADGNGGGLRVFNISDPTDPRDVAGYHYAPGYANDVAVAGDYTYVAIDGLRVFDVSDPATPTEAGSYQTTEGAKGVAVAGGYVYLADGDGGLFVLRFRGGAVSGLLYEGPLYLPATPVMLDEVDDRITMGDHVHLRFPFRNVGSQSLSNVIIELLGGQRVGNFPGVSIYNGTDWRNLQTVSLLPVTIPPGGIGYADFWIYVTDNEPQFRPSLPSQTWLRVRTDAGQWAIWIALSPIAFHIPGNDDLEAGSCLHNPDSFDIQKYAQYAAGTRTMSTPSTNDGDPDTPEQAVRNLVERVYAEFHYRDRQWPHPRVPDTTLLTTRHGDIGVCRHYADLTTGLLRSLGLPGRYVTAALRPADSITLTGHARVEAYPGSDGWRQADSTWNAVLDEGIYEERGYSVEGAWADRYPLADSFYDHCVPLCYQPPVDCARCLEGIDRWHDGLGGCTEDVRSRYHNVDSSRTQMAAAVDEQILVRVEAPVFVTRTVPFNPSAGLVNSTTQTMNLLTATISLYDDISSTLLLYDITPAYHTVSNLAPGGVITVTWTITPLVAGVALPLRVAAFSGDSFNFDERPLVVNELGGLPPLTLGGLCGAGTVQPGECFTVTAYVLDETLQPLTDVLTTITTTIYATPTLGYSATVPLFSGGEGGLYQGMITLPVSAPLGSYLADFAAVRPGHDAAYATSTFFAAPPLTVTLGITPLLLRQADLLTLTAEVHERGMVVTEASVHAEVTTPGGVVTVPLVYGSGVYTTTFRPADLAPNVGGNVRGGEWQIVATADYYGSTGTGAVIVTVFRQVYLPLALRNR